jgi:hypothetical protein
LIRSRPTAAEIPPTTTATGEAPLSSALSTLALLEHAIREEKLGEVPGLARKLVAERAIASAGGADVSRLNDYIATKLDPMTKDLEPRVRWTLRYTLGAIVPRSSTGRSV